MNRLAVWTLIASLPSSDSPEVAYRAIGDVATVMGTILREHVDGSDPERLAKAAIDGMLAELDPWSRRVRAQEVVAADQDDAIDWSCSNDGDILKLRIHRFDAQNPRAWFERCPDLQKGLPLLLDLRGNKGGYLDGALSLSDRLVKGGILLTEVHRRDEKQVHRARDIGFPPAATAILVDGDTASAAELLAGILRDRIGAQLWGQKTRGKGSIQHPLRLANGDVVLITTGRFQLPGGELPDGRGLSPNGPEPRQPAMALCLMAKRTWRNDRCTESDQRPSSSE
ncbi:MAG: hypothetical protein CMH50_08550 [Myxococcales bacterium]|nr:hypothetical protein [Myxococcales bacterium]